jgi:hypothetical protein
VSATENNMLIQSATYQRKLEVDREVTDRRKWEDLVLAMVGLRREDMRAASITSVARCDEDVVTL